MGCCRSLYFCFLFFGCVVSALVAVYISLVYYPSYTETPQLPDRWWGRGQTSKDKEDVVPFKIDIPNDVLTDLKARLSKTKYSEPLEDAKFEYGFNSDKLKDVVKYWKDTYDWKKHEKELNKYEHFKTQIDGISVHFVRVKPASTVPKNVKVIPVMMIHGWPGSFYEFYKAIPNLSKHHQGSDFVLDIIVPSIPGYGFSEAAHKQGFHAGYAAKTFHKLMTRLGFNKYYVQGGDWGTVIATNMGILHPESVIGIHTNGGITRSPLSTLKQIAGSYFPKLFYEEHEIEHAKSFVGEFKFLLKEMGYCMLQATKPDTVGTALQDSPAGLAAYILEKFSTWTDPENTGKQDGGLTQKFKMDELLTNVMIYWVTDSITSSQRFYKETFSDSLSRTIVFDYPVKVPSGIIAFPHEIMIKPKSQLTDRYLDLVTYTRVSRGGHFGAFEEPDFLSNDFLHFVKAVETRPKSKK